MSMTVEGNKSLLPFQKGFMMSIAALKGLYSQLQNHYGVKNILTARLNQDCLENLFSQIRGLGRRYDHPTPTSVKHRFRLLLIARNSVELGNANVQRDADDFETDEYVSVDFVNQTNLAPTAAIASAEMTIVNDDNELLELSADDVMAVLNDIEQTDMTEGSTASANKT